MRCKEKITAEELLALASQPKAHGGPDIPEALRRAAETVNALTVRAGKAERELCEARRELVGTRADQRTAETCARRLEAELTLAQTAASELRLQRDEAKATADNWQELLVGATKHLSDAEQERDAARAELAALRATDNRRAETADLLEVERCKRSIEAAACDWCDNSIGEIFVFDCIGDEDELNMRCATWPEAERAAWEHAAAPYRERIEAAGFLLELQFGMNNECGSSPIGTNAPVVVLGSVTGIALYECGEQGGYPSREALEAATAWAEEHPANSQADIDGCTCGHEHDGCEGCRHIKLAWNASPCVDCMHGQDGPQECRYDPAPLRCEHCGKPRRDADE